MFECRACVLRCIRAIAGDDLPAVAAAQQGLLRSSPRLSYPASRRSSTTLGGDHSRRTKEAPRSEQSAKKNIRSRRKPGELTFGPAAKPGLRSARLNTGLTFGPLAKANRKDEVSSTGKSQKEGNEAKLSAQANRKDEVSSTDKLQKDGTEAELSAPDRRAIQIELRYLTDPLKLAEHVHYTLRCNKPEKALELCRMASKTQEVVVSWNHCVDWHMKQGRVNGAFKIYNEMKKRGQHPDSYTSTLILRGLAAKQPSCTPEEQRSNVAKAISILNSLGSPTSRVKASILHTNAALTVCSESQDMDAIWGIVKQIPKSGKNAADERTYAILLNALRYGAFPNSEEEGAYLETMRTNRIDILEKGRGLWEEIVRKWSSGDLWVDEKLVVAMGRLLLWSKRLRDWDDVLSLVQQTMNVERQLPALGSADRHTEHIPTEDADQGARAEEEAEGASEDYKDTLNARVFSLTRVEPSKRQGRHSSFSFVPPDNATLSLLIQACHQLRSPKAATSYWDLLTKSVAGGGFGVKPDLPNFHALLRLLAVNRSSAKVAKLLEVSLPAEDVTPVGHTFRLAMSVCQRDLKNTSVMRWARKIVDVMARTLSDPDVQTIQQYLSLATAAQDGSRLVATLDHLDPILHVLKSKLSYGMDTDRPPNPELVAADRADTIVLFRAVVGAIDTAISRGMIPRRDSSHWHGRRQQLIAVLGRQQKILSGEQTRLGGEFPRPRRRRGNRFNPEEGYEHEDERLLA